jgi:hypothetical protein
MSAAMSTYVGIIQLALVLIPALVLLACIVIGEMRMRREAKLTNGVYGSKAAGCGGGGAA